MKAKVLITPSPQWPAVLSGPLYDPDRSPHAGSTRLPRPVGSTPIELRIDAGDGPSAIAILE